MNILVIVPVFNCAKGLLTILPILQKENTIIINDGSNDNSLKIIKDYKFNYISYNKNYGVGHAIKAGINYGLSNNYKYCITLDGDGQHNPTHIEDFINAVNQNNFVIGNRFYNYKSVPEPKLSSNLLACLIINKYFKKKLYDVTCGFRAFPISSDLLYINNNGFDFLHTHLLYVLSKNISITSIDIDCIYDTDKVLCSPKNEILDFINSFMKFYPNIKNQQMINFVLEKINKSESFNSTFDGVPFYAEYLSKYHSYIIKIDKKYLYQYFNK